MIKHRYGSTKQNVKNISGKLHFESWSWDRSDQCIIVMTFKSDRNKEKLLHSRRQTWLLRKSSALRQTRSPMSWSVGLIHRYQLWFLWMRWWPAALGAQAQLALCRIHRFGRLVTFRVLRAKRISWHFHHSFESHRDREKTLTRTLQHACERIGGQAALTPVCPLHAQ